LATLAVQILGAALGLGSHIALTWMLGSEVEYGIYLVGLSTIVLAAVPVVYGWDTVLMRYLPTFDERRVAEPSADDADGGIAFAAETRQQHIEAASRLSRFAAFRLTRSSLAAVVVGSVVALLGSRVAVGFDRWTAITASCVIASVPLLAWSLLRQGALRGRHRGAASAIPELIVRPTMTVALTAVAVALGGHATGDLVLIAQVVAAMAAVWLGSRLLPDWLRRNLMPTWSSTEHRSTAEATIESPRETTDGAPATAALSESQGSERSAWHQLALASTLTGMAVTLTLRVDEWLLGMMVGPAAAGIYGPASRFAGFVVFGLNAVNPVLAPLLAAHKDDRVLCQRLAKRGARLTALVSTPLALICMLWPELLLGVLPAVYSEASGVLRILAFAQWINTLAGSVGILLAMTGFHRHLAVILVGAALLDIALCLMLIPPYGPTGAAVATAVTIITWNIAAWWVVRVKLGIDASAL